MLRKLYALVAGDIPVDNPDSQTNQDILLPGHLYLMIVKEKLQEWLDQIRIKFEMDIRRGENRAYKSEKYFKRCTERSIDVGARLEYFLATGNIQSNTGLDLLQKSGYCIVAEKLNYLRYLAHFRGVHRGQFFSTMKTTKVRKLLPEAWGYLCPVHTPDGAPCGLLNHLTSKCQVRYTHPLDIATGTMSTLPPTMLVLCRADGGRSSRMRWTSRRSPALSRRWAWSRWTPRSCTRSATIPSASMAS